MHPFTVLLHLRLIVVLLRPVEVLDFIPFADGVVAQYLSFEIFSGGVTEFPYDRTDRYDTSRPGGTLVAHWINHKRSYNTNRLLFGRGS